MKMTRKVGSDSEHFRVGDMVALDDAATCPFGWEVVPGGEGLLVDPSDPSVVEPEPRWHEIATEGLPGAEMEGDGFFVWRDGCPVAYTDDYARDRHPCFLVEDWMGEPTHWMLCPLPAPPTTERR